MNTPTYDSFNEILGREVRREREARGWSLREFALIADVNYRLLFEIEHGTGNPTFKTLLRLAEGFNVPLSVLLGNAEASHFDPDATIVTYRLFEPQAAGNE